MQTRRLSTLDRVLTVVDHAVRALTSTPSASRPRPLAANDSDRLDDAERRRSGALMRVDHVGEVCAQALYVAQSVTTSDPDLRRRFEAAAGEEGDHLAWTSERLAELGTRKSLLNPLWYASAFGIGLVAGRAGDARSLGFVVETERQVEQHLASHLDLLPAADLASRAIVAQMKDDEVRHAIEAERAGAARMPAPLRWAMRMAARVMTTTAYYV